MTYLNYNMAFVGKLNSDLKKETKDIGKNGARKTTLSFQLASETNKQYVQFECWDNKLDSLGVEIFPTKLTVMQAGKRTEGMKPTDKVKAEKKEIAFADRLNPELIKNAPKFVQKEAFGQTFITYDKDMIAKIEEELKDKKGTMVFCQGKVEYQYSKGKGQVYQKFNIEKIRFAKEDEVAKFQVSADVFFLGDAIDSVQYADNKFTDQAKIDKVIPLNLWVGQNNDYNDKTNVNFMPLPVVVNMSKVDFEKHAKLVEKLEIQLEDFANDTEFAKQIQINYEPINGAEEVELTDEEFLASLPERTRRHIEKEIITLESVRKSRTVTKETKLENRFKGFGMSKTFEEGAVVTEFDSAKVYDYITEKEEIAEGVEVINATTESLLGDDDLEALL